MFETVVVKNVIIYIIYCAYTIYFTMQFLNYIKSQSLMVYKTALYVKWGSVLSQSFHATNGVRGGISAPHVHLFNVYK